ncbi:hypothetical protein NKG60_06105 [Mesorhizobium sp. M1428]|uniref:hypothetical protein n=1 Tax=Mesorhizobium sp. M1428 TaxID=2957102 RepID=UPI0033374428
MPPTEKPHAGKFRAARRYDYSSILALPTRAMKIRAMKISGRFVEGKTAPVRRQRDADGPAREAPVRAVIRFVATIIKDHAALISGETR